MGAAVFATVASSVAIQLLDGLLPRVPIAMAVTAVLLAGGAYLRARPTARATGDALLALGVLSVFGWASALVTALPAVHRLLQTTSPAVAFLIVNATKLTSVAVLLALVIGCRWDRRALLLARGHLDGPTGIPRLRWVVAGPLVIIVVAALFCTDPKVLAAEANRDAVVSTLVAAWPFLVAGPLVNAVAEEVLYRHALIGTLRPLLGVGAAVVVSSAIFGLAHLTGTPGGWAGVLFTFAFGIVCALAMIQNRGMVWNTTIHVFADLAAVTTLVVLTAA